MRSSSKTSFSLTRLVAIGGAWLLVVAGCARPIASPTPTPPTPTSTPAAAGPNRVVPTPRPVRLPKDEAAHADQLEWWYYNGHLDDERGQRYGFHFVVFQGKSPQNQLGYISNIGITDLGQGEHAQGYQVTGNPQPQPPQGFAFKVAAWDLRGDGKTHAFKAEAEGYTLDLSMTPTKPAALHNEIGWLDGPSGWTYYYSWTRMEAQGTLTKGNETVRVKGTSWMDHQWGDFIVPGWPSGWQWFALQLEDGSELMVTEARDRRGATVLYGTFVDPAGRSEPVASADGMALEVTAQWESPHTRAEYPAGWRLRVPSKGLEFELRPAVADQEITAMFPPSAIYWEGALTVTGTKAGAPLGGEAYAELVGYVRLGS